MGKRIGVSRLEIAWRINLKVSKLRMDRGFAKLPQDVVDEARRQDQASDAETDGSGGEQGATLLPDDIAECQSEQHGLAGR
jgi:hypothetical protein